MADPPGARARRRVRGGGGPRGRLGGPPAPVAADRRDAGLGRGRRLVRLRRLAARRPPVRRRPRLLRSRPERVRRRDRRLLRGLVAVRPTERPLHARRRRARRLRVHARRHAGDRGAPADPRRRRTFAGAAWPVTLVPAGASTAPRRPHPRGGAPAPGGAAPGRAAARSARPRWSRRLVVFAALVAVELAAVAKGALPRLAAPGSRTTGRAEPVSVPYVWDADYDGIKFPKKATTVMTVEGAAVVRRTGGRPRWTTTSTTTGTRTCRSSSRCERRARSTLVRVRCCPRPRANEENWVRQDVTIEALRDTHSRRRSRPGGLRRRGAGGRVRAGSRLVGRLGARPAVLGLELRRRDRPLRASALRGEYPAAVGGPEVVPARPGLLRRPPFGQPAHDALLRQLFDEVGNTALEPLYRQARQVVGTAAQPVRGGGRAGDVVPPSGGFTYDEPPPVARGACRRSSPSWTRTKRGYCQHFAGAMALMLRYLGIPARVAAGFTSGEYDKGDRSGRSRTPTRTPGSRSGSPGTGGCRSTRPRGAGSSAAHVRRSSSSAFNARRRGQHRRSPTALAWTSRRRRLGGAAVARRPRAAPRPRHGHRPRLRAPARPWSGGAKRRAPPGNPRRLCRRGCLRRSGC